MPLLNDKEAGKLLRSAVINDWVSVLPVDLARRISDRRSEFIAKGGVGSIADFDGNRYLRAVELRRALQAERLDELDRWMRERMGD